MLTNAAMTPNRFAKMASARKTLRDIRKLYAEGGETTVGNYAKHHRIKYVESFRLSADGRKVEVKIGKAWNDLAGFGIKGFRPV
jgi:hypothetical protein